MTEAEVVAVVRTLSFNMAMTLRATVDQPNPHDPDSLGGKGRIYTGLGKYTTVAARGVFMGLRKRGLAVSRPHDPQRPEIGESYLITAKGRRVAEYVRDHWRNLVFP